MFEKELIPTLHNGVSMIIRVVSHPNNKLAKSLSDEICKTLVKYGHCVQSNTRHPCIDENINFVISIGEMVH